MHTVMLQWEKHSTSISSIYAHKQTGAVSQPKGTKLEYSNTGDTKSTIQTICMAQSLANITQNGNGILAQGKFAFPQCTLKISKT